MAKKKPSKKPTREMTAKDRHDVKKLDRFFGKRTILPPKKNKPKKK